MAKKKQSRTILTLTAAALIVAGIVYSFWPQPTLVDIGVVTRGPMTLTINEEARTRVRDTFIISAPVSGHLLRVDTEPNDVVQQGQTVVARILPSSPPALNAREREQARTAVQAAEASIRVERANMKKAISDHKLARTNLSRSTELRKIGSISQYAFDQAQQEAKSAEAALDNAKAAIALREAELANAQAALIGLGDNGQSSAEAIDIKAPINGRILQVMQESEVVLTAGTPILEIGNIEDDLEIIVELLSTDAVQISKGDRVIIQNWGGDQPLSGSVARIDPFGFTKYSALGVEEQRVNGIIRFSDQDRNNAKLGHGFRVEVQIVIWENADTTIVPSSALFRKQGHWSVFVVENGTAQLRAVQIEQNNGIEASVLNGLQVDDRVVLYPPSELEDGTNVISR